MLNFGGLNLNKVKGADFAIASAAVAGYVRKRVSRCCSAFAGQQETYGIAVFEAASECALLLQNKGSRGGLARNKSKVRQGCTEPAGLCWAHSSTMPLR